MNIKVRTHFVDFADELNIYIYDERPDGRLNILTSFDRMEFQKVENGAKIQPSLTLGRLISGPFLQALADEMHRLGIRAKKEPVLENELVATKYHLEDMRKLVFKEGVKTDDQQ